MIAAPTAPPRARVLFVSINDGSDTRINKEIATLSREFEIDFVGISPHGALPFFASHVRRLELVRGRSRSIPTLMAWWWRIFLLRCQNHYDSIHLINEELYILLWPLLLGKRVVLDVFDSLFLKTHLPAWLSRLGQRFCYAQPKAIIVTDVDRASLLPRHVSSKILVVPNYPFRYTGQRLPRDPAVIRILYAGSLVHRRGTEFLDKLLATSPDIHVVMAGWIRDQPTQALSTHPRVEWLGLLPQSETIAQASRCDFILCHYEPSNQNNIYASPNKIYDAIQVGVPVIINPEARISRFVREHNLGLVLEAYAPADMGAVAQSLRAFKATYRPDPALASHFLWENVEPLLLAAHRP